MSKIINLIGQKFGRLIVIQRMANNKWGDLRWLCLCDCGNEKIIVGKSLRGGLSKSCGCLNIETRTKHGYCRRGKTTGTYESWRSMKQRCTNPNRKQWKNYGGRKIKVCERWSGKNGFIHFLEDMGEKPMGLTLERKNNNKNYCKSNCRWATLKQQNRNKRNNHLITCFGKTQCIVEWSEETGIPYQIIWWRLNHDWSPEKALTTPVKKYKKRKTNG